LRTGPPCPRGPRPGRYPLAGPGRRHSHANPGVERRLALRAARADIGGRAAEGPMSDRQDRANHLPGLRRFAVAITVLNILGHAFFGFEQSFAQPLVSLAAAYSTELVLEAVDACCNRRRPRFAGGPRPLIDFLLSAHITGLAVAMLLFANDRLWVV